MYGVIDSEYIGIKHSSCGVIFEFVCLLLGEYRREIDIYHRGLFTLEDFGCEKYPNAIHRPIDEVRFFVQCVPEKISHVDMCVRYPLMQNKTQPISWDHRMWMSNDESDKDEWK